MTNSAETNLIDLSDPGNEELPIVKFPDDMFQELFQKYLTAIDLLKVKATCKLMKQKCEKAEQYVTMPVDLVCEEAQGKYVFRQRDTSIRYHDLNILLKSPFKIEAAMFRCNDKILDGFVALLGESSMKIRAISLRADVNRSANSLKGLMQKFSVEKLHFQCPVPHEYFDEPVITEALREYYVYDSLGSLTPEELMRTKICNYVTTGFPASNPFTIDMARQVIKELAYGERHLTSWNILGSGDFNANYFPGMSVFEFDENTDYEHALSENTERPLVFRLSNNTSNFFNRCYAVACTDGSFYSIWTTKLSIRKVTLHEWVDDFRSLVR